MSSAPKEPAAPATGEKPRVFRSPLHFLAFGFGSGLSPRAPGTAGTVVALLLYLFMADWPLLLYSV
ncbi:MAG: hypothetical protein R3228_17985, partial [Halioglobus sp.]|nr:hypothetical protein [Halioglobus sp.]